MRSRAGAKATVLCDQTREKHLNVGLARTIGHLRTQQFFATRNGVIDLRRAVVQRLRNLPNARRGWPVRDPVVNESTLSRVQSRLVLTTPGTQCEAGQEPGAPKRPLVSDSFERRNSFGSSVEERVCGCAGTGEADVLVLEPCAQVDPSVVGIARLADGLQ